MDQPNTVQAHTQAYHLSIHHKAMPPLLPVSSPPMPLFVSEEWEILNCEVKQPLIACMLETTNLHMILLIFLLHLMTELQLNCFKEKCV